YTEINESTDNYDISFEEIVALVMSGNYSDALRRVGQAAAYSLFGGFKEQKEIFVKLLLLGIIGALFKTLASTFIDAGVAKMGGYIMQIALIAVLSAGMVWAVNEAEELLEGIIGFMEALIPTYALVITAGSGSASAVAFYELVMVLIFLVDKIILNIVIPGISIYMMINMMNYLSKDNIFGRLAELVQEILSWINKTLFGFVIGLNVIKGLISPMLDSLKGTAFTKIVGMIPGVGTAVDAVSGIIIGSGALIKNSIGVTAMLFIVMLCAMPALKLFVFSFGCKAAGALLEPVADKSYTECINGMHEGLQLLLVSSCNAAIMFLLTLAILCSASNAAYFAGT
ncbi:MAG: stage III sporulation protein AE, partial [Lachnospiraceae bacterium]